MSTVAAPTSPYKGLAAFEDSDLDALLFFGRDRDSEVIAANLMASRLTILFGPTGVGKTSVLRAGVAYRLRREAGVEVRLHSSWTGDPREALADVTSATNRDLYLILDQFEEYFLYHEGERAFVEELAELVRRPELRVNVLIGIREDALAELDAFRALIPNLLSNRLRLQRLDRAAGKDAILGPVGRFNELVDAERRVEVEPALVEAVLDQVAAGRVELGAIGRGVVAGAADAEGIEAPYLQLVMARLWEVETERGSNTLRLDSLRELGGAAQIVHDHLEHAMAELSPRQKDAAAAMYNFLVTPSGTKIAHGVGDLAGYAEIDEDEAADVLRRLAAERIVRASADDGAATRYEIYHDVLADAVAAWRNRHRAERAVRESERRRRRAFAVATAALISLVLVAAIAIFALVERSNSRAQARRAHARELAAAATSNVATNPPGSVRLALRAAQLEPGASEEAVLRDAIRLDTERAVMRAGSPVRMAAFDPTGRFIAAASKDGKVRIYRTGSTAPLRVLDQGGSVSVAVYSRDGRLLTAGRDGTARLWSRRGVLLHRLAAGGPVRSASFGRHDSLVLTLAYTGDIRVWRAADGKLLLAFRVNGPALPKNGAIHPARDQIVIVGHDRFVRVYSLKSGALEKLRENRGRAHCAVFTRSGSQLATCGHEGTIKLWARLLWPMGELHGPARGHAILDAAYSPNGFFIAGAVDDGTARLWDVRTGQQNAVMFGHALAVTHVAISPTGRGIVTGSLDTRARTWDINGKPAFILAGHTAPIASVAFSPDGRFVVTASDDGTARLWESGTEPDLRIVAQQGSITAFAVSPDGKRVLVGDAKGVARERPIGAHRVIASTRTSGPVTAVAFGPGGRPLAASSTTLSLAVSRGGTKLARGRRDGSVSIQTAGGARVLRVGKAPVTAAAFSPDGTLLVTGTAQGAVRLWNIQTRRRIQSFVGHRGGITSATFSPDGKTLLTASFDHTARTWNVQTGRVLQVMGLHFGPVKDAAFSRDGQWVVTAGSSGASVIDAATGRRILILHGPRKPLVGVAFGGRDGRVVVTAGRDGTIRTYRCEVCSDLPQLMSLARRRLRTG